MDTTRIATGRVACAICGDPFCFDGECAVVNRSPERTYRPCKHCGVPIYYSPADVVNLHRDGEYFCEGRVVVEFDGSVRRLSAS